MEQYRKDTASAVLAGASGKCPRCTQGKLFKSYLSVVPNCPNCGLALSERPGEILAVYLVISVVGFLAAFVGYWLVMGLGVSALLALFIVGAGAVVLALVLLPPIKGAIIGFQWAQSVQGFDSE